ncbi:hypothetical protein CKY04_16640 [Photorhabdus sp. S8-52]|nr:hypothetical protein CKY03_16285 [Photorhabdus sp. S9-53]RAX00237.1 hypothetical protein CKY04_16640 [Photorhabdus sp. S8-52]
MRGKTRLNLLMYIMQILQIMHCLHSQSKPSKPAPYKALNQIILSSWGVGGRRFKSYHADQISLEKPTSYGWFFYGWDLVGEKLGKNPILYLAFTAISKSSPSSKNIKLLNI